MKNLFAMIFGNSRGGRKPRTQRLRPRLEGLEDRLTPATFYVTTFADVINPNDGLLSLREALSRANATAEHDTIMLQTGTYKIAIPHNPNNPNASGSFDFLRSATLVGAGAGKTVVDGARIDRVFAVTGTSPGSIGVTFQGLTIRGGGIAGDGGGILMGHAHVTLRDCVVAGNLAARHGGGIANALAPGTGNLTLIRTAVTDNVAGKEGGGIFLKGNAEGLGSTLQLNGSNVLRNTAGPVGGGIRANTVILTNSSVSGNKATEAGGGLYVSSATLTGSVVGGNSARFGGGIRAGVVDMITSTVRNNTAFIQGGGIEVVGTANLINCTVSGNFAVKQAGGLSAIGTANLTNSTVSSNRTQLGGKGGGIVAWGVNLLNCTIARNEASFGGGVVLDGFYPNTVRNTIIAINHAYAGPAAGYDVVGAFGSRGHNLIGDVTGSTGFGAFGDLLGTSQKPLDPKLGALQDNGGPTQTMALLAGSLAIDRGDPYFAPSTDQRGVSRPRDGNGDGIRFIDIGAYER